MQLSRSKSILLSTLFALSGLVHAQNMQVIGSNSFAQECYRSSTAAALANSASRNDLESCTRALQHSDMRRSDVIATYINRGVINVAMQNFDAAANDYNKAIDMNETIPAAYVNRGNLWFITNRLAAAISDYDRALELNFSQPYIAILNRGLVKEAQGELLDAQQDYLAALELKPDWNTAQEKLARVNKKLVQREQAENQAAQPE